MSKFEQVPITLYELLVKKNPYLLNEEFKATFFYIDHDTNIDEINKKIIKSKYRPASKDNLKYFFNQYNSILKSMHIAHIIATDKNSIYFKNKDEEKKQMQTLPCIGFTNKKPVIGVTKIEKGILKGHYGIIVMGIAIN